MKKLFLIRHAKSSWKFDVIDHERPLTSRGLEDSVIIANSLKSQKINPDLVMVSDAVRTKKTAEIILNTLEIPNNRVVFNHNLYDFEGQLLTQTIKKCSATINTLMVFCHNHALTSFVNTYGSLILDNVPTCGVVEIDFNITDWKDLNTGVTLQTLFPKALKK